MDEILPMLPCPICLGRGKWRCLAQRDAECDIPKGHAWAFNDTSDSTTEGLIHKCSVCNGTGKLDQVSCVNYALTGTLDGSPRTGNK